MFFFLLNGWIYLHGVLRLSIRRISNLLKTISLNVVEFEFSGS